MSFYIYHLVEPTNFIKHIN